MTAHRFSEIAQTVVSQIASLILALHVLANELTFFACFAESRISARCPSSTLSIAFAGVKNAGKS